MGRAPIIGDSTGREVTPTSGSALKTCMSVSHARFVVLMDCARYHGRKVPTSVVRDNIVNIDSHMQCLLCIWHRRPRSLHLGCVVDWVNLRWEGRADTDCQGGQNLAAFSNMFFVSSVTWRWRQVYSDSKSTPKKAKYAGKLH